MTLYRVTFGAVYVEAKSEEEATIKAGNLIEEDAGFFAMTGNVEIMEEEEEEPS